MRPRYEPPRYEHERERDRPREILERERRFGERPIVYAEMAPGAPCPPSPMAVMSELLARGEPVPPFVVQCAIAEAELAGQYEVAYRLQQEYVIPALAQQGGGDSADLTDPPAGAVDESEAAPAGEGQSQPAPNGTDGPAPDADSPIQGVPRTSWCHFLSALAREPVAFATPKHVGRYRQQRARLAEVGFDPAIVEGDPAMQDLAMTTDLADCFRHLHASGSLDACVGRAITLPGHSGKMSLTLSGLLGVCSVAGLERAIDWCENEADRVNFPHTTMAAIRTNGTF